MSSSMTAKTGVEPFAGPSAARGNVRQTTEQRGIVRTEGEEGHGIDGLVRQS
jgi:hypothetical protein